MESQFEVVEPAEKRERKLVIEWPEKKDLMKRRDKFVTENQEIMRNKLRENFAMEKGNQLEELSQIILTGEFMIKEMVKISPIPLDLPFKIVEDYEYQDDGTSMGIDVENGDYSFSIYVYTLWELLDEGKKELDIKAMAGAVHEFAHMIYRQEGEIYKRPRKIAGIEEEKKKMFWGEDDMDTYLALDRETRARIWELNFLKHYFPNSEFAKKIEQQIRTGRWVRKQRRKMTEKNR